jgi:CheY-like chemotaxis protein
LIADDEPALRRSLALMLASAGFVTLEASDGLEAVEHVKRRDDISVVLLDASMPRMDGIEATREIRCLRAGLPIVMMSGHVQEPLVGIEMVTKPFEPDALVELLRSVIAEA